MNAGVRIRRAHPGESSELTALAVASKAFWGYDAAFMSMAGAELAVGEDQILQGRVWVYAQYQSLMGFAIIHAAKPDAELEALFVAPEHMRKGVGSALFRRVAEEARKSGCCGLLIEADPHAEPFYRKQGAIQIGQRPSGSIPGRMLPWLRWTPS